jgi:hypothetical protein
MGVYSHSHDSQHTKHNPRTKVPGLLVNEIHSVHDLANFSNGSPCIHCHKKKWLYLKTTTMDWMTWYSVLSKQDSLSLPRMGLFCLKICTHLKTLHILKHAMAGMSWSSTSRGRLQMKDSGQKPWKGSDSNFQSCSHPLPMLLFSFLPH